MAYCHGPGLAMVYNDRFAAPLGARHPRAWGQHAALVMPEIWSRPGYPEAVEQVLAGGPSFHDEGGLLDLRGGGLPRTDWAYLARSYSPVRAGDHSVLGVLVVVVEMAPVLVLVGGAGQGDYAATSWQGIELWDETVARQPLIWSGFRSAPSPPAAPVSEPDQRFVTPDGGQQVLPINGPDIAGSIGYLGMRRHLPDVQMVTLAGRQHNDVAQTDLSSEFYDVFEMPDGTLAITVGDVKGAGNDAGAVRAQVQAGLRGATLTSSDPRGILAALDELVAHLELSWPAEHGHHQGSSERGFGGELFVTALLGIFDPATGDLALASAGHIPPAVVRHQNQGAGPGRLAQFAQIEPGPPLGVGGNRPVTQIVLYEGDALVAVTKGMLERHARGFSQGQSRLLGALSAMAATAARSISQHVVDTLIGDKGLEHDGALLVVVRDSNDHQMSSVLVPPHTTAVRGARRWARVQLEAWGLDEDAIGTAVMCVSELVTNVVQHAGTPARVTMELADRLLVTVEDTGTWSTPHAAPEDHSAAQGRGLALVAAVSDATGHSRGVDGSTVWFEIAPNRVIS
jgi:anti-sigma regulatory factor (Ser/Thr protein kinase)